MRWTRRCPQILHRTVWTSIRALVPSEAGQLPPCGVLQPRRLALDTCASRGRVTRGAPPSARPTPGRSTRPALCCGRLSGDPPPSCPHVSHIAQATTRTASRVANHLAAPWFGSSVTGQPRPRTSHQRTDRPSPRSLVTVQFHVKRGAVAPTSHRPSCHGSAGKPTARFGDAPLRPLHTTRPMLAIPTVDRLGWQLLRCRSLAASSPTRRAEK